MECDFYYYYDFKIPYEGGGTSFPIDECRIRSSEERSIVIYISPSPCLDDSACDGSQENPFDNLVKAFLEGWRMVNSLESSSLNFRLVGNGLDADKEEALYFVNKLDYLSEYQYLFRTTYSNINISAAYCYEYPSIPNCIKNKDLRPIVVWRTESLHLFVVRSMLIYSIVFDGSES